MSTINLSMFPDSIVNPASAPYNTKITAEQPWVDTDYSLYDSDIEVRSSDGFIFQLHRVLLGATTGAFPGSEMDTGGEIVQLTEPAEVLAIVFAFLYPKALPDLHGTSFALLAAVAEAAGKYEVFSAAAICNERLVEFLPKYAPEILAHAVKHDYPRLISKTLPHLARAPFLQILERLPPSYMLPWARYRDVWKSVFKELDQYVNELRQQSDTCSTSSYSETHTNRIDSGICKTCAVSLRALIAYLESIDALSALHNTLQSPKTPDLQNKLACCRNRTYSSSKNEPLCPFVADVTKLCQAKIDKIPSFATFLGLKE